MGPETSLSRLCRRSRQLLPKICLWIGIFLGVLLLYTVWTNNQSVIQHWGWNKSKKLALNPHNGSLNNASTCALGQTPSIYRNFFRQYAWVEKELLPREIITATSDNNESLPLIFWDRRILYHPVSTEGCRFKCRYTMNMAECSKAHLAVFTANPPSSCEASSGKPILAFESAEPYQFVAGLSDAAKTQISFYITHHTFSTVSAYYGVYRAFRHPNCVMSAAEREALKRRNSLHLLPSNHSQRTKMVAWAVSDMKPATKRIELGAAISKYVLVDKYGRQDKKCPKGQACFEMLSKEYKFYLAFENNNCEGYITEKFFFNALGFGMVPIVYGASREEFYQRAPPNSYIHVDDFENVEQLAKYLQYLDKNDTAYATYFAWKEHGEILLWPRVDCRVCGVLYEVLKGKVHLQSNTYWNYYDKARTCSGQSRIKF
ncbi:hypothetical protein AAHC03_016981 [Spirometra sp. Aus1]